MYENELLKEDVQALREELQRWKEAGKKHVTRDLETLAKVVDQLGNPHSISENEELLCHECGELFKSSRYKVEKTEITS